MRLDTSQSMRLSQQMKLAPRMIQSMEILQMPMLALEERIEQELESNIALEQAEPGTEDMSVEREGDASQVEAETAIGDDRLERKELVVGDDPSQSDDWERLSNLESTYREAFDNEYSSQAQTGSRTSGERDRKMDAMANVAARGASLTDQLLDQWKFAEVDPDIAFAGQKIIAYINSDGLLGADLATIHEQNRNQPGEFELTMPLLEKALLALQLNLEPPGIGARDNRECFLLQVDALEAADDHITADRWDAVRLLIRDHYDDLLQNRLPRIAQKTQLSMDDIHATMELMKRLKLSPGRDLVDVETPPIMPDVVVEFDEQRDEYVAALSDGRAPVLRISQRYEQMAKDKSVDSTTREFISNNVRNAQWLIESINQRKNTLLRVVNVVLARQREYFDHGPQHLKPLPMIEVADQLGIHVGTVSRAVSDKWMQTPRGLVALRKFFSGGTSTQSGEAMSWDAVKATLQEIIDNEDKGKPMSDDVLVDELKKRGIEIARRTVVKYRQQLDIPPARRRKQH